MKCLELIEKEICNADCCGIILDDDDNLIKTREDGKCIHLDINNKCKIYDKRPKICKDYGTVEELQCPYINLKGNIRSPAKQRRMQRIINKKVDYMLKELEQKLTM